MNKPFEKKLFLRIFGGCVATLLIAGMVPGGTALFWSQNSSDKATKAVGTSLTTKVSQTAAQNANKAPISQNLSFETYSNITVAGKLKAIDPEGDAVTFQIVKKPALGEVTVEGSGFRYVPYQNKSGDDFFTYAAVDAKGNTSSPATVDISVKKRNVKASVTYADMDGNPAHYPAIKLSEKGIIIGEKIGSSYFLQPNRAVTRNEFVAMAVTAAGLDIPAAAIDTGFDDDDAIAVWAKPYVAAAVSAGFITGSTDERSQVSFRGSDTITRAEAAVIINKLAGLSNEAKEAYYKDASEIPVWAVQATANVGAVNIMNGYSDGTMRPNAALTRADAVQLLYNSTRVKDSKQRFCFSFWVNDK